MKYKRLLLLTLLLGLLAWTVPLAAQVQAPLVKEVRVSIKGNEPGKLYTTQTMNEKGERLPVTFVIECYPAGSWKTVSGIRFEEGILPKDWIVEQVPVCNPKVGLLPGMRKTELGWELRTWTIPGRETERGVKVEVLFDQSANGSATWGSKNTLWDVQQVKTEDVHATSLTLKVTPGTNVPVDQVGTIEVVYDPPQTTDKRVKFEQYKDKTSLTGNNQILEITPTEKAGVYAFKAKKLGIVEVKGTAEDGLKKDVSSSVKFFVGENSINGVVISMSDGKPVDGGGSTGINRIIYRHKTKVWKLQAELTSNGPLSEAVLGKLNWTGSCNILGGCANGLSAIIYSAGDPGSINKKWGLKRGEKKEEAGTPYKTTIEYTFKADVAVDELELKLAADKSQHPVEGTYKLKVEDHVVKDFTVNLSKKTLYLGADKEGFINVTPIPEDAYEQGYTFKPSGGPLTNFKQDPNDPNRRIFSVKDGGTETITLKAIHPAGKDAAKKDVTVVVEKVKPESITVYREDKKKSIAANELLKLNKGESAQLRIDVTPNLVYDSAFVITVDGEVMPILAGVGAVDTKAGRLEIKPIGDTKWFFPGVYEVKATRAQKAKSDKATIQLETKDARDENGKKVQFQFEYAVDANAVDKVLVDKSNLEFIYDIKADRHVRGGAQRIRVSIDPPTASDGEFQFDDVPEWLDILDVHGNSVVRPVKKVSCTPGEYYVKVKDAEAIIRNNLNELLANITVKAQNDKTATLSVKLKYIKVTGYEVKMGTELFENQPMKVEIKPVPENASNPTFWLAVASNLSPTENVGKVAMRIVVEHNGEKVNATGIGPLGNYQGGKACLPGEFFVKSKEISQDQEKLFLQLKAAEHDGFTEDKTPRFTVQASLLEDVAYGEKGDLHELKVKIRDEYFPSPYTWLKVSVKPKEAFIKTVHFKQVGNKNLDPVSVEVKKAPVDGYYLFKPTTKDFKESSESLQAYSDDKNKTVGFPLSVNVVNVKATSVKIEDMEGNDLTDKSVDVIPGVTTSYPLRVKVGPYEVSSREIDWTSNDGNLGAKQYLTLIKTSRDSLKDCLVLDYLVTVPAAMGPQSVTFTAKHKYDGESAHLAKITFNKVEPKIEELKVEPNNVVLVGSGDEAEVKVTFSPGVVQNDAVTIDGNASGGVDVKPVSKVDNVYTYKLKAKKEVVDGKITFKGGGGTGVCTVSVFMPQPPTKKFELLRADGGSAGLNLQLGDATKGQGMVKLFANPVVQEVYFKNVQWTLKRGNSEVELSKYLRIEKTGYNQDQLGSSQCLFKLTALNVTREGANDAPLVLTAKLAGTNKESTKLNVHVGYAEGVNKTVVETISFPTAKMVLAAGETKTVRMNVTPDEPSLQQLTWDIYPLNAKHISVKSSPDDWKVLEITGVSDGNVKLRVSASDAKGQYTKDFLDVTVKERPYDVVLDARDGMNKALENVHVVVKDDKKVIVFEGWTQADGKLVCQVQGSSAVLGKTYTVDASLAGYTLKSPKTVTVKDQAVQHKMIFDRDLTKPVLYPVIFMVKDDKGNPVENAEVSLPGFAAAQVSDANGRAAFYEVPANVYYATVSAEGYEANTNVLVEHQGDKKTEVPVTLKRLPNPPAKYDLVVYVSDETQSPLLGARVVLDGHDPVLTNIDGEAVIKNLEEGVYSGVVELASYDSKPFHVTVRGGNVVERLSLKKGSTTLAGHTLTVVVLDEIGVPIENAEVRVAGGQGVNTNADGLAKFGNLVDSPSPRVVEASKVGYVTSKGEVTVNGGDKSLVLTLKRQTYKVTLTVRDEDDKAVKDAEVYLDGGRVQKTGDDGVATFTEVPAGQHVLLATAQGFLKKEVQVVVSADWSGDVRLSKGFTPAPVKHTLTVTVEKPLNNPVEGAKVCLPNGDEKVTDRDGKAAFEVIDGTYNVTVLKTGYHAGTESVKVAGGNKDVTIKITPVPPAVKVPHFVTVTVIDAGSNVALESADVKIDGQTPISHNGNKWVYRLFEGNYVLTVTMPDYQRHVEVVKVGDKDVSVDVQLPRGISPKCDVTVVVADVKGAAIEGAHVEIGTQKASSTQEGKAAFTLELGSYTVKVTKDGYLATKDTVLVRNSTPKTKNVTLRKELKVTFNADGGTLSNGQEKMDVPVAEGTNVDEPSYPERPGFTLVEWQLDGAKYDFSEPVNDNITLKAKWQEKPGVQTYTVIFDSDGGSAVPQQKVEAGNVVRKPVNPTKTDFTFVEWQLNGKAYVFSQPVNGNITLKAVWKAGTAPTKYTVTFDSDGGTAVAAQTVKAGDPATKPANPTKDDFTFVEWQLDGKTYDFSTKVNGNITLKAVWKANPGVQTYKVTFDSDGGTAVAAQTVKAGETATKPADPTKTDFTFVEWQLNGVAYDFSTKVNADITLKAQWKANPGVQTYKVTFDSDGGTAVAAQTVKAGETATKPADPKKGGYDFVEWQLDGKTYDFSQSVNGNITLKAVWKANGQQPTTYTVTFDSDGGTAVQPETVKAGETATKPADPEKDGFTFVEWQLDGVAYNFDDPVNADFTLKAVWKENGTAVESELLATVRIYPNPATVTLVVSAESVIARYELVSLNGTKVLSGISSESELRLDVSQLSDGVYVLLLEDAEGGVATRRVLVRR